MIRLKSFLFLGIATWGNTDTVFACQDIGRRGFFAASVSPGQKIREQMLSADSYIEGETGGALPSAHFGIQSLGQFFFFSLSDVLFLLLSFCFAI